MKASELRIGNWVTHIEVENVKVGLLASCEINRDEENEFEGIRLDEEWLEKFGFYIDENAGNWHSPEHTIYSIKGFSIGKRGDYIGWYNAADDDFYSTFYPQFEFVHQIQNFYFALHGKELEIKS